MNVVLILFSLIICGGEHSINAGGVLSIIGAGGGGATPSIVGGNIAAPRSATYLVALHNNTRADYQIFCAASLLNMRWALTAAHCVAGINTVIIDLIAGTNNKDGTGPGAQKRFIEKVVIHPNYVPETILTGPRFDIALIKTTVAFVQSADVLELVLPEPSPFYPSGDADIWGWGSSSYTSTPVEPAVLQVAVVRIVNYVTCSAINLPNLLTVSNVCSAPGNKGACVGDSGGPMTQVNDDSGLEIPTIMAVVSYGYVPCGSLLRPTVYSNVAYFVNWIQATVAAG